VAVGVGAVAGVGAGGSGTAVGETAVGGVAVGDVVERGSEVGVGVGVATSVTTGVGERTEGVVRAPLVVCPVDSLSQTCPHADTVTVMAAATTIRPPRVMRVMEINSRCSGEGARARTSIRRAAPGRGLHAAQVVTDP
jgi:hypothetical protein